MQGTDIDAIKAAIDHAVSVDLKSQEVRQARTVIHDIVKHRLILYLYWQLFSFFAFLEMVFFRREQQKRSFLLPYQKGLRIEASASDNLELLNEALASAEKEKLPEDCVEVSDARAAKIDIGRTALRVLGVLRLFLN